MWHVLKQNLMYSECLTMAWSTVGIYSVQHTADWDIPDRSLISCHITISSCLELQIPQNPPRHHNTPDSKSIFHQPLKLQTKSCDSVTCSSSPLDSLQSLTPRIVLMILLSPFFSFLFLALTVVSLLTILLALFNPAGQLPDLCMLFDYDSGFALWTACRLFKSPI